MRLVLLFGCDLLHVDDFADLAPAAAVMTSGTERNVSGSSQTMTSSAIVSVGEAHRPASSHSHLAEARCHT
jgi:hypothetical protein